MMIRFAELATGHDVAHADFMYLMNEIEHAPTQFHQPRNLSHQNSERPFPPAQTLLLVLTPTSRKEHNLPIFPESIHCLAHRNIGVNLNWWLIASSTPASVQIANIWSALSKSIYNCFSHKTLTPRLTAGIAIVACSGACVHILMISSYSLSSIPS